MKNTHTSKEKNILFYTFLPILRFQFFNIKKPIKKPMEVPKLRHLKALKSNFVNFIFA